MIDTAVVRVHQRGACIADNNHQEMGRSRGGLTSKIHAVVDANGLSVHLALTPGEAHDNRLCSALLSALLPQTMLLADRCGPARRVVWQGTWSLKLHAPMPIFTNDDGITVRARRKLLKQINVICPVQSPLQKYFASPVGQIISTNSRHPTPPEGRIMIVTDVGEGCGGRGSVLRAMGCRAGR